jgi:hypothetical protein
MNTTSIMKNPIFTPILFEIERRILACVHATQAAGIDLNDSQIRSTLNKVRKSAEGKKPQIPNASPREKALAALHEDLLNVWADFMLEDSVGECGPLSVQTWTLCIRTIEESIQRHSTGPGSRGYQNFLEGFIKKGLLG